MAVEQTTQQLDDAMRQILQQIQKRTAHKDTRMMVASGLIPFDGTVMLRVLYFLSTFEQDQEIRAAAIRTIKEMPSGSFDLVLDDPSTPGDFLDLIATIRNKDEELLKNLVRHSKIHDKTLITLASTAPQSVLEAIVVNQHRLISKPILIDKILENPSTSRYLRSRMLEFKELFKDEIALRQQQVTAQARPPAAKSPQPAPTSSAAKSQPQTMTGKPSQQGAPPTPPVVQPSSEPQTVMEPEAAEETAMEEGAEADAATDLEDEEFFDDDGDEKEPFEDVRARMRKLPISEKLLVAQMGSKQERYVLIRDPNKKIALAALMSPKITDFEAELAAKCRSINEDVLREMAMQREWQKNYGIMSALVRNPKTPPAVALRLLSRMMERDLKDIEADKDISYGVRAAAKRLYELRIKRKSV